MELAKLGYLDPGMKVRINGKVCRIKEQCNVYSEGTKYRWEKATGDFREFFTHLCELGFVQVDNARIVGSSILDDEGLEIRDYRVTANTPSLFVFEGTSNGIESLIDGLTVAEVNGLITHYNDNKYYLKFKEAVNDYKEGKIGVSEFKEIVDIKSLVKNVEEFEITYLKYGVDF